MNINDISVEELAGIKITSVEQGRLLAEEIRLVQVAIHRQMVGLDDKKQWQLLCDQHYDLRKIRQSILHTIGRIVIKNRSRDIR